MIEFHTTLKMFSKDESRVYRLHLPVPSHIAEPFIQEHDRRVKCTFPDGTEHTTGLMPFGDYWFLLINEPLTKKMGLSPGAALHIRMEKDDTPYGMPMSEELQVLLDQDEAGNRYFHALTPGKQRTLIHLVNQVKNADSRLNKALAIITHLKNQSGKLNFKLLNETIKEFNQQGKLK